MSNGIGRAAWAAWLGVLILGFVCTLGPLVWLMKDGSLYQAVRLAVGGVWTIGDIVAVTGTELRPRLQYTYSVLGVSHAGSAVRTNPENLTGRGGDRLSPRRVGAAPITQPFRVGDRLSVRYLRDDPAVTCACDPWTELAAGLADLGAAVVVLGALVALANSLTPRRE